MTRARRPFRRSVPAALAGLFVAVAVTRGAESDGPLGMVTGVIGIDVELRRPDQPPQFVQLGLPLLGGDEIFVPAAQSAMVFLFAAGVVLEIQENSLLELRRADDTHGVQVRLGAGRIRVLCSNTAAASGMRLSTPLGRCRMVAGVLSVEHRAGETAGASRSTFGLGAEGVRESTTVARIDGASRVELVPGAIVVVPPKGALQTARPEQALTGPREEWSDALPLAAARIHRLRVAEDVRNDLVQRTALAAALRLPVTRVRRAPQSIIDQPAVQPRGPSQVIRLPSTTTASRTRPINTLINELARQNVGNIVGLLPGRGPVPTGGPNSLLNARR